MVLRCLGPLVPPPKDGQYLLDVLIRVLPANPDRGVVYRGGIVWLCDKFHHVQGKRC